MNENSIRAIGVAVVVVFVGFAAWAQASPLVVTGSPGHDSSTSTGLKDFTVRVGLGREVNNRGEAVGKASKYLTGTSKGYRAVRWDGSGTAAVELGDLGTNVNGVTGTYAFAINNAGMAVGHASKYAVGSTTSSGLSAVRWDSSGTSATELGNLGTSSSGYMQAEAFAINDAGTAVGYSQIYGGNSGGSRAVRWNASGTVATELGNLGTDMGYTNAQAYAINNPGTAVGWANQYGFLGAVSRCAVRWSASGTTATKLGDLGADSSGATLAEACAINDAGTAIGYSEKYIGGIDKGPRAVRWSASGTASTELGTLGTNGGSASAYAYAINDSGDAVGYSKKYDGSGGDKGQRAVRWDAGSIAATELADIGTDSNGVSSAQAYAVNSTGAAVGTADKYVGGAKVGSHAVIWLPDASAIDLNDLGVVPLPVGGDWILTSANALSADGWVAGVGSFDPDGTGPLGSYLRGWVAQVGLGGMWTKAAGGTWGRGPNWSTGTPAMQVGNATFNLNSSYTIALDRNELTKAVAFSAGTVTFNFAGHTLATENGLSIAPGATLKGSGTIAGNVSNVGTLAPGDGVGTLNINGSLVNTSTLELEIAGRSLFDTVNVSDTLTLGGSVRVDLEGYVPAQGDVFSLMTFSTFVNGGYTFDFTQAVLPDGLRWDVSQFASSGCVGVVPEPGPLVLLGAALGLLTLARRRRRA
jgi:hypothetical protein